MSEIDFGAALKDAPEPEQGPGPAQAQAPTSGLPMIIDTQPAALLMHQFEKEVELLLGAAREIEVIRDEKDQAQATEYGNLLKKIRKQLELHQDWFVRPHACP